MKEAETSRLSLQAFKTFQKEFVPPIWKVVELSNPSKPLKRSLFHLYEGAYSSPTFKTLKRSLFHLYEGA